MAVPVEDNITLIFDELAVVVALPESFEDGLFRGVIVLADDLLEVLGGLLTVV
jgi:hypothetical protein